MILIILNTGLLTDLLPKGDGTNGVFFSIINLDEAKRFILLLVLILRLILRELAVIQKSGVIASLTIQEVDSEYLYTSKISFIYFLCRYMYIFFATASLV